MEKDEEDGSGDNVMDENVYQFTSPRAEEIILLLKEYRPVQKGTKEKLFEISQEILERDSLKGRKMLLVNSVMKILRPNGRVLNVIDKSAKKGMTKLESKTAKGSHLSLNGDQFKGSTGSLAEEVYFEADWQYSPKALGGALSAEASMPLNQWAVQFSILILAVQSDSITSLPTQLKVIGEALKQ
jgi:hypothetical protein